MIGSWMGLHVSASAYVDGSASRSPVTDFRRQLLLQADPCDLLQARFEKGVSWNLHWNGYAGAAFSNILLSAHTNGNAAYRPLSGV